MWWHGGPFGLSGGEQRSLALGCGAGPARRAVDRTGRRAPWHATSAVWSHSADSSNVSAATSPGSSASSRCAAVAETGHRGVDDGQRGVFGCEPMASPTDTAPQPRDAVWRRARPSHRAGHTRRASRVRPRPCARDACRAAGAGVRASVSRSAAATRQRPGVHRSGDRRRHETLGGRFGGAETPAASRGRRPGRSSPLPRRRRSAHARRSAAGSRPARAASPGSVIRTGNIVAPWAVRRRAAPARPRRRCAP